MIVIAIISQNTSDQTDRVIEYSDVHTNAQVHPGG